MTRKEYEAVSIGDLVTCSRGIFAREAMVVVDKYVDALSATNGDIEDTRYCSHTLVTRGGSYKSWNLIDEDGLSEEFLEMKKDFSHWRGIYNLLLQSYPKRHDSNWCAPKELHAYKGYLAAYIANVSKPHKTLALRFIAAVYDSDYDKSKHYADELAKKHLVCMFNELRRSA